MFKESVKGQDLYNDHYWIYLFSLNPHPLEFLKILTFPLGLLSFKLLTTSSTRATK